jgi:hypothetical protein
VLSPPGAQRDGATQYWTGTSRTISQSEPFPFRSQLESNVKLTSAWVTAMHGQVTECRGWTPHLFPGRVAMDMEVAPQGPMSPLELLRSCLRGKGSEPVSQMEGREDPTRGQAVLLGAKVTETQRGRRVTLNHTQVGTPSALLHTVPGTAPESRSRVNVINRCHQCPPRTTKERLSCP